VRVLAATCPGRRATRLAKTTAPGPTAAIEWVGTVGCGTAEIAVSEQRPQPPSQGDPDRDAEHDPDHGGDRGLPGHRGSDLSLGESERLQEGELATALAARCDQRESERADGPDGEDGGEERGGRADAVGVDDLGAVR